MLMITLDRAIDQVYCSGNRAFLRRTGPADMQSCKDGLAMTGYPS
jgi:hypothetical protein